MLGKRDSRSLAGAGAMVTLSAQRRIIRLRSVIKSLCQLTPDPLVSGPCVHCSVVSVTMCAGHHQPIRGQLCVSVDQSEASCQASVPASVSMSAFLMVSAISRSHRQSVLSMTLLTIMFKFCSTNYAEFAFAIDIFIYFRFALHQFIFPRGSNRI